MFEKNIKNNKLNKKKILIIANGFYPQQTPRAFRATELVKEFSRQGHNVTIMAPHKENIQLILEKYNIEYINLGKLKWKIPTVNGLGKVGTLYNKAVSRLLPLLFEFPRMELFFKVKREVKRVESKFDILISVAVPHTIHWAVAANWHNRGENIASLWFADCGDPYCIQENDTFQPPFYFRWIEKWFMRKVDYITVPTVNSYKGYFSEFYSKLKVIPQGFRFEDINRQEVIKDGVIRFGYGGSFTLNRRDPRYLLEFLSNLDKSYEFEFHIFTSNNKFVESYSAKDKRIILHPPIPRKLMLEKLSSFNFVINLANYGTAQTPSKLIDYEIIEKPILQIDPKKLDKNLIIQFLASNYENRIVIENPEQYKIEEVVNQFLILSNKNEDDQ